MRILVTIFVLLSFLNSSEDVFAQFENSGQEEHYFEQGKRFYQEGNLEKAYENFSKAADLGHQKAQYNLGVLYSNRKFMYSDPKKAFDIFSNLARENYAPAQNRMGMYYSLGVLAEKDYIKAVKFYEEASKQGYITAQCNLALMYASGKGVFINYGRAHSFAKKGYEEGHPICKKVWSDFNLGKYEEDKGFKFNFYTKP